MDEDIAVINELTKEEKIKNFFSKNKKNIFYILATIIIILFSYFFYNDYKNKKNSEIANKYLLIQTNFTENKKIFYAEELINIIYQNNKTYSLLALSFIIDNDLIQSNKKVNELFDQLINNTNLDKDIKNLLIFKKAIFNSEFTTENELIETLKPIINSKSVWQAHALLLVGDFFLSKGEKEKSKDFFNQVLINKNANQDIIYQTQLRLRGLLSE